VIVITSMVMIVIMIMSVTMIMSAVSTLVARAVRLYRIWPSPRWCYWANDLALKPPDLIGQQGAPVAQPTSEPFPPGFIFPWQWTA
jgi:hypothetical protein